MGQKGWLGCGEPIVATSIVLFDPGPPRPAGNQTQLWIEREISDAKSMAKRYRETPKSGPQHMPRGARRRASLWTGQGWKW